MKHFDNVLIEFVYRSANGVAHLLVTAAHSMSDLGEWLVTPPEFIGVRGVSRGGKVGKWRDILTILGNFVM